MADDVVTGPPVHLLSDRLPFEHPQYIGPTPHNLPPPIARPGQRGFQPLIAPGVMPGMEAPAVPPMPFDDKYRYATLSGESIVAVGAASVLALAEPAVRRNFLGFRNSGATNLFIAFGANATTNSFLRIAPNVMILFDTVVPQDEVYCISDAAGGQLTVAAGNYVPGL